VKAALSPSRTIDPPLASAERGDLARVVVATGKIQPLSKVEIKSKASGIVKKLYVDYGERVKQGQCSPGTRQGAARSRRTRLARKTCKPPKRRWILPKPHWSATRSMRKVLTCRS